MNRDQKAATIEKLVREIESADAVFAVDYRGISVPQAAELRTKLREADATFRVVKNSLTERAADQAGAEALKDMLQGPTALTFVRGDAAVAAKAIADYARATQLLPFKGGLMEGGTLDAEQIRAISRLPSRTVLYGQLVGVVASPVTGLVRTLNALIGGLAVALGQVREKKESGELPGGESPAGAEANAPAEAATAGSAPESAGADDPASAPEPVEADPDSGATAQTPEPEVTTESVTEEDPAQEVQDSPASDEAPASAAAAEAGSGAEDVEQAEPEATPEHTDNQADASA